MNIAPQIFESGGPHSDHEYGIREHLGNDKVSANSIRIDQEYLVQPSIPVLLLFSQISYLQMDPSA